MEEATHRFLFVVGTSVETGEDSRSRVGSIVHVIGHVPVVHGGAETDGLAVAGVVQLGIEGPVSGHKVLDLEKPLLAHFVHIRAVYVLHQTGEGGRLGLGILLAGT